MYLSPSFRATCLEVVAMDCPTLEHGLQPSGVSQHTTACTNSQYRTFYNNYQSDNLGGGLFQGNQYLKYTHSKPNRSLFKIAEQKTTIHQRVAHPYDFCLFKLFDSDLFETIQNTASRTVKPGWTLLVVTMTLTNTMNMGHI